jgi:hypothetical protein
MDAIRKKFKKKKTKVILESYFCLLLKVVNVFKKEVHNNMSAKSAIKKI